MTHSEYVLRKYLPESLVRKYSWVNADSEEFEKALRAIALPSGKMVIIAGAGGCGKSVLYRIAYDLDPKRTLCTASTGIAAYNLVAEGVPATTIHSALRIKVSPWYVPEREEKNTVDVLKSFDTLLIDEVSMMDANLMDNVLWQVKCANKKRKNKRPIKVILFGDVLQLPPVFAPEDAIKKLDEETEKSIGKDASKSITAKMYTDMWIDRYGSHKTPMGYDEPNIFFFSSPLFQRTGRQSVELYSVYRQDDREFKRVLSRIRFNKVNDEDLAKINSRVMDLKAFEEENRDRGFMYLAASNKRVVELNNAYMKRFKGMEGKIYEAVAYGSTNMETDFRHIERIVTLYPGMQVMCIANDRENREFQNGTMGIIIGFDKGLPIVRAFDGREFRVPIMDFEKYSVVKKPNGEIETEVSARCRQIACKCAYAVTFHKAQGLTLDAAYLDFSGSWAADGSAYLGLSRVRSLNGIGLLRPLEMSKVKVSREAMRFFLPNRDDIPPEYENE